MKKYLPKMQKWFCSGGLLGNLREALRKALHGLAGGLSVRGLRKVLHGLSGGLSGRGLRKVLAVGLFFYATSHLANVAIAHHAAPQKLPPVLIAHHEPPKKLASGNFQFNTVPTKPQKLLAQTNGKKRTDDFYKFLETVATRARAEGIGEATIKNYLLILKKPLATSIAKDRAQGEFILSFRTYHSRTVTTARIARAKQYEKRYRKLFDEVEKKYDVPRSIILAFWALESTFGDNIGRTPAILSLATLAYEGRRRNFFTTELIAALRIIDKNYFKPSFARSGFVSSWAGAMGQVQFMPSTYLRYAVDGDGDGVRDLWNNPADIIHSTANFVSQLGWNNKTSWGQQVSLPSNFPYRNVNDKNQRSFHYWRGLGVKDANGNLIGDHFFHHGTIVMPMSAQGPIFLVENNFAVIKKWNNSNFFALSIGVLADNIAGKGNGAVSISKSIPDWQRGQIITMQTDLQKLGFLGKTEAVDGVLGPNTRGAIQQYQKRHGMVADGYPSREFFTVLKNDSSR